jgi:hypothetical protein
MAVMAKRRKGERRYLPPEMRVSIPKPTELYHYTVRRSAELIIKSGEIKPTYLAPPEFEKRAATWFSSNPIWEGTASKGGGLLDERTGTDSAATFTHEETHQMYGLCRFIVHAAVAPHGWKEYIELSGIPKFFLDWAADRGRRMGANPHQWFVTFGPVEGDKWNRIEEWNGAEWVPYRAEIKANLDPAPRKIGNRVLIPATDFSIPGETWF